MALLVELGCVGALLGLAVVAIAIARSAIASRLLYAACLAVSALAFAFAVARLGAEPASLVLPLGLPWLGAHFRMDGLAAFFLCVVNFGAAAASLYAIGYGQHESHPGRVLPFIPAFLAGMNLVLLADDAVTFLIAWEFMSLSSWALVVAHHGNSENVRAGYIYLVMAAFGAFCLFLAFGLLAGADGAFAFDAIRARSFAPGLAALALVLTILGAGSKAGLVPVHVWLPLAHPAAPSNVSALMSGVMTKVAIYAFVRIVFDLLGPPQWWWSILVLSLGGITAVLGVLYAMFERDMKRLLAYSTVENIGIVFIGLGLALAFHANGMNGAAALALTGALLHVANHAAFKMLLFFGAGAVQTATGLRDIEQQGGLIHRMPVTSFVFLVGSAAIAALPPLNGFVSEWLTFQAVLFSPQLSQWGLKLLIPTVGTLLALAAALAGACFVRAFGMGFLGRPRSAAARDAHEVDPFSLAAMILLAVLCACLGLVPGLAIDWFAPVVSHLVQAHMPEQHSLPWLTIVPTVESRSSYNGLLVFLFITVSASLAVLLIHTIASRAVRRAPAWDCGTPNASPLTQYTASSFAQPIRRVFGTVILLAREKITMRLPGDMQPSRLRVEIHDVPWEIIYAPLTRLISRIADRMNRLQFMTIRRYLSLVFVTLVSLLVVLAIWS